MSSRRPTRIIGHSGDLAVTGGDLVCEVASDARAAGAAFRDGQCALTGTTRFSCSSLPPIPLGAKPRVRVPCRVQLRVGEREVQDLVGNSRGAFPIVGRGELMERGLELLMELFHGIASIGGLFGWFHPSIVRPEPCQQSVSSPLSRGVSSPFNNPPTRTGQQFPGLGDWSGSELGGRSLPVRNRQLGPSGWSQATEVAAWVSIVGTADPDLVRNSLLDRATDTLLKGSLSTIRHMNRIRPKTATSNRPRRQNSRRELRVNPVTAFAHQPCQITHARATSCPVCTCTHREVAVMGMDRGLLARIDRKLLAVSVAMRRTGRCGCQRLRRSGRRGGGIASRWGSRWVEPSPCSSTASSLPVFGDVAGDDLPVFAQRAREQLTIREAKIRSPGAHRWMRSKRGCERGVSGCDFGRMNSRSESDGQRWCRISRHVTRPFAPRSGATNAARAGPAASTSTAMARPAAEHLTLSCVLFCQGAGGVGWTGLGGATPCGAQARIRSHRSGLVWVGWGSTVLFEDSIRGRVSRIIGSDPTHVLTLLEEGA